MLRMWMSGLMRRRGSQTALSSAGVAVAISLVAVIGVFSITSARTMTERALAQVPVDWQVEGRGVGAKDVIGSALKGLPRVFDPPPDALDYPMMQIALFAAAGVTATIVAVWSHGGVGATSDGVPNATT